MGGSRAVVSASVICLWCSVPLENCVPTRQRQSWGSIPGVALPDADTPRSLLKLREVLLSRGGESCLAYELAERGLSIS